ncbi:MAG: YggS family pyridoxal phosphate-dependent enzyme [Formosimonas sp.]
MSNTDFSSTSTVQTRLTALQQLIQRACENAAKPVDSLTFLAVSKTQSVHSVHEAYQAGLRDFGENYAQEGVDKIIAMQQLVGSNSINWHFIGPLQSNKTRLVAEYFAWVHSVERFKIAQRLAEQRPAHLPDLNVCIQVNISHEANKSGCLPDELIALALHINALPRLKLRGLMAIPAPIDPLADDAAQREPFVAMKNWYDRVKAALPLASQSQFDTLSMGMSNDFPHAIAAGATIIRIGSALFGARNPI